MWLARGTLRANPASERRCAESTKCLRAPCGRRPVAVRRVAANVDEEARAGSSPIGRRSTDDPYRAIGPPAALLTLFISHFRQPNYLRIQALHPVLKQLLVTRYGFTDLVDDLW